jgi:hypothetical protein
LGRFFFSFLFSKLLEKSAQEISLSDMGIVTILEHHAGSVLKETSNLIPVRAIYIEVFGKHKIFLMREFDLSLDWSIDQDLVSNLQEVRCEFLVVELLGNLLPVTSILSGKA